MSEYPTKEVLQKYIAEKLGLESVIVDQAPTLFGSVSLVPFGFIGSLSIYRDDAGVMRAAPVSFGVSLSLIEEVESVAA